MEGLLHFLIGLKVYNQVAVPFDAFMFNIMVPTLPIMVAKIRTPTRKFVHVRFLDSPILFSWLSLRKHHLLNFQILAFTIYLHCNSKSSSDDAMGTKSYVTNIKQDLFINLIRKWYYWDWVIFLLWSILDWLIMGQFSLPMLSHYPSVREYKSFQLVYFMFLGNFVSHKLRS